MPRSKSAEPRDTSIQTYRARRDFSRTAEPAPDEAGRAAGGAPIFVVQKHDATRLHWDFRLEHGGVLWSWAVPRGPSLDPHDKRLAVHVEDHPLDYADFHGTIPAGQYGAGTVETWDRGTWAPADGRDPAEDMRRGEIKFVLRGKRLHGHFVLVRLKPRERERAENWLLIKEHDEHEAAGVDAAELERTVKAPRPAGRPRVWNSKAADDAPPPAAKGDTPPAPGAKHGAMPETLTPQLAELAEQTPLGKNWVSEVKFDGYRLLAFIAGGTVRLLTRNGHDWTNRLPHLAAAVAGLGLRNALLDGEMVALDQEGRSDFSALQAALSEGRDKKLFYYAFDLLHLDGWDLRPARLVDRKAALRGLAQWTGAIRYSDHMEGQQAALHDQACARKLEGIICKQADAPYRSGRSHAWVKVKCAGREEFVVLGWTPPQGHRTGIGALHLGFHDPHGVLHYAGAVGTGFSDAVLAELRQRLDKLAATRPDGMEYQGAPPERSIAWVRPDLVAELRFAGWTADGRVRHASFLGLREDKAPRDVVRPPPHEAAEPDEAPPEKPARRSVTVAKAPAAAQDSVMGVRLSHPEKELWPGISKRDLADYWAAVAPHALPEIAGRPLAIVRCPDGIEHQHFFQKHPSLGFAKQFRAGAADGAPYLVLDDAAGLIAAAQMAAMELHAWGATEADPLHPDRLVFDLDPGDGVTMAQMAAAAGDVRSRLKALGLASFCRTSGGKGLHVVAPLTPRADWNEARAWCRAFAELMVVQSPDRYVAAVKKSIRSGKILVDWLRNGLGSTAIASFSPRARPGAGVATRLAWREVTEALDPAGFTLRTVPARLAKQKTDPWAGFADAAAPLPRPGAG